MNRSQKMFCMVATFALLTLICAACTPQSETVGTSAPAAEPIQAAAAEEADEPIKIGALTPLSAPGAVVGGEAIRAAMLIAIDEINDNGGLLGQPVELIVVDTEGLPERGIAVAERLINQDGVVAMAGSHHSSVGVAVKEVAHNNGIPVVFVETWNDTITSVQYPEVFRLSPLNSEVAATDVQFIQWLRDEAGASLEKVVILTENTDYGIPAAEETSRRLAEVSIGAVTFSVDIGTQDFAGIIERIKAENPDMIVILPTGEAAFNFTQQAADAGIGPQDVPTLCNHVSLESNAYWKNVPDGNYCFVRRIGPPPQLYNDVAKNFLVKYAASTGKEAAESSALAGYDAIHIIAQAVSAAGSTDPLAIIAALENISHEGSLGTITFPVNQNNTPDQAGVDPKWWHQFPDPAITFIQYQAEGQNSIHATVIYPAIYQTGEPLIVGQ